MIADRTRILLSTSIQLPTKNTKYYVDDKKYLSCNCFLDRYAARGKIRHRP